MPSGVAGDMLLAALIDCAEVAAIEQGLVGLGLGPIGLHATTRSVSGIQATHCQVVASQAATWQIKKSHEHDHDHDHSQQL